MPSAALFRFSEHPQANAFCRALLHHWPWWNRVIGGGCSHCRTALCSGACYPQSTHNLLSRDTTHSGHGGQIYCKNPAIDVVSGLFQVMHATKASASSGICWVFSQSAATSTWLNHSQCISSVSVMAKIEQHHKSHAQPCGKLTPLHCSGAVQRYGIAGIDLSAD
jgi:hypothetical protein